MKNCTTGKRCGRTCINNNYTCRAPAAPAGADQVPNCTRGKHCGKSCIPLNKTCKDEKNFQATIGQSNAFWIQRRDEGERHIQHGYPAPANTCVEAQGNLERDIITLEDKANPSATDCKLARYFCNPSTAGGYGGSRIGYTAVLRKCP